MESGKAFIVACTALAMLAGNAQVNQQKGLGLPELNGATFEAYLAAVFVTPDESEVSMLEPIFIKAVMGLRSSENRNSAANIGFLARLVFGAARKDAFMANGWFSERALQLTIKRVITVSGKQLQAVKVLARTQAPALRLVDSTTDRLTVAYGRPGQEKQHSFNVLPRLSVLQADVVSMILRRQWPPPEYRPWRPSQ